MASELERDNPKPICCQAARIVRRSSISIPTELCGFAFLEYEGLEIEELDLNLELTGGLSPLHHHISGSHGGCGCNSSIR